MKERALACGDAGFGVNAEPPEQPANKEIAAATLSA